MGQVVVPIQTQYNIPCDMCHKPFRRLYPIDMGGKKFLFCSGAHAAQAQTNWEEKKKLGMDNPGLPSNIQRPNQEMVGLEIDEDNNV